MPVTVRGTLSERKSLLVRYTHALITFLLVTLAPCGFAADAGADAQSAHAPEQSKSAPVAPKPEERRFNIWEWRVEGNTLLDKVQIERTVYPFLGPSRSLQDVENARQALETVYRDAGYPTVIVDIPEQDVSEGIVKLQVIQGTVARVRVTGSHYFALGRIRAGVPALAEGEVPNLPALQEQLKAVNQAAPDRSVTPIFRPGPTPGTVEAELRVKDELPLHADFELNDRYSKDTSKLRASVTLRYANLWQREHSASIMYQTSPQDTKDVEVYAGTYVMPLAPGEVLAAYLVNSKSDVATAGNLSVIGDGTIVGTRLVKSLAPVGDYFHSAIFGFDYKDFKEDVLPQAGTGTKTPIDYVNFVLQYRATLAREGSKLTGGLGANFGVRGLGNSVGEFENKRYGAKPNYFYVTAFGDYTRDVAHGIQLYAALDGQLADSPLVSNEQFSAGGAESVRGYYESQVLGDDGITGNLEVRTPSFADAIPHVSELRFLVFADGSWARIRKPLPSQTSHFDLYGTGLGFRLKGDQGLAATLDWAWALATEDDVHKGDSRVHFSLHYGF